MLKIGLTGGIGSGKSEVNKLFSKWGAFCFDADIEAKIIIENNKDAQNEIIKEFNSDVLNTTGLIDKNKLARIAFYNEENQLALNSIIHPYVFDKIDDSFEKILKTAEHELFIVDAALIFESGGDTHMDYNIVVTSPLGLRIERTLKRGGIPREDIMRRIQLQWTDKEKTELADFTIQNNSGLINLEKSASIVFKKLMS